MTKKRVQKIVLPFIFLALMLMVAPAALAYTLGGPLSAGDFADLNDGASYGPQTGIRGHEALESGPLTFESEDLAALYGTGKTDGLAGFAFVVSIDPASLGTEGAVDAAFGRDSVDTVSLAFSDFVTHGDAAFGATGKGKGSSNIAGIGNGEVNGVRFSGALHAGFLVSLDPSEVPDKDALFAYLGFRTPVDVRVDIFGVSADGRIISNTPNSGAIGVLAGSPGGDAGAFTASISGTLPTSSIPEPGTMLLLALGTCCLGMRCRIFPG